MTALKIAAVLAVCLAASAANATAAPAVEDGAALARASGCMACHAVDRRMVGPSFRDISARYAGQSDAKTRMAAAIRRGGSGAWGPIPMPSNQRLSDAQVQTLAAWSLSHTGQAAAPAAPAGR